MRLKERHHYVFPKEARDLPCDASFLFLLLFRGTATNVGIRSCDVDVVNGLCGHVQVTDGGDNAADVGLGVGLEEGQR